MNRVIMILLIGLSLAGCNNTKTINGVTYDVYGIYNQKDKENPDIEYKISVGSMIAAVLFSETIIVPLYVLAVDLWEPVGVRSDTKAHR